MENEILISIIIPCYNLGNYIDRCINSLKMQEVKELEFIFVNDGSTDGTLNKLLAFEKEDNRVIVINKNNEGVSMARNDALKIAKGEYVLFLDGDDFINSYACEEMYALVKDRVSDLLIFGHNVYQNGIISYFYNHGIPEGEYSLQEFLDVVKMLPISYKLYKREIIANYDIYFDSELKYGEVFTYFLNYLRYCDKIYVSNSRFYNYVVRTGSAVHVLNYENEVSIIKTVIQIDIYANKFGDKLKSRLCYHKAVFHLVKALILAKYVSLNLRYENVRSAFSTIYNSPLVRKNISFVMINDTWSSQDKYISILLNLSLKLAYNTVSMLYSCKRLLKLMKLK